MNPTAKSLIIDLLSTLPADHRGSMPVRALVAAAGLFEISENALRVALARLRARGAVERDERGRYRMGPRSRATSREVAGWRRRDEALRDWRERRWVAVHGARPDSRAALRLLGFRELHPGLALRPDNLEGGVDRARARLQALDPAFADGLIACLSELDRESEARALGLWDTASEVAAYDAMVAALERSEQSLAESSTEQAMVETFLLGGRALRMILLDPLLPEELVPRAPRDRLVARMRDYDALGRACWAEFLSRYDVTHYRPPADLGAAAPLH